jgi:uncharacterized repeat protein (TIGR01451 family)
VLAFITVPLALLAAALLTAIAPVVRAAPLSGAAIRDASYGVSISKSVDERVQDAGGEVTYRIVVANLGTTVVRGATVIDDIPDTVTGVHWTCTPEGGATCAADAGDGGRIAVSTVLPPRGRVTVVAQGTVTAGAAGGAIVNRASVDVPSRAMIAGGVTLSSQPVTTAVPATGDAPGVPTPSDRTREGAPGHRQPA